MSSSKVLHSVVGLVVLCGIACGGATTHRPETLAEARALAAERNVPLLIDFYTEW